MSFVSSKGNILCRLIKIELYKIFAIIIRAIKGLHCIVVQVLTWCQAGAMPLTRPMMTQFADEYVTGHFKKMFD